MMTEIDRNKIYGFLPGCSLSSYNPESVRKTIEYLNKKLLNFAAILKCCGKPTRDLGQYGLFSERFSSLEKDIKDIGVNNVILACPNCMKTFQKESKIPIISLWEILPQIGLPEEVKGKGKTSNVVFTIHDSCAVRYEKKVQEGIRWILDELGYSYVESKYSGENTKCCGFGGMVNTANPDLAAEVLRRRIKTLGNYPVVCYCASCRSALMQGGVQAWHILDLIWGPIVTKESKAPEDILENTKNVWNNRAKCRDDMEIILPARR